MEKIILIMKRKIFGLPFTFTLFYLLVSLFSCNTGNNMERHLLFNLSLGKGEDQLDLIQMSNIPFNKKTRIVMRDGLIFIANGNSNKVMEFNSFGDILSLYYNPKENPRPVLLSDVSGGGGYSNRNAYAFNFRNTGEIAVTGKGHLFVEDSVPDNRLDYDKDTESILSRIVLQFDGEGNFINFLGREGIGGTPFPYIESIKVNNKDEIIIVTRIIKKWIIYWFTEDGSLKFTINIPINDLPVPSEGNYIPSLETIVPDQNRNLLYLKINYYNKADNSLDYTDSYLWTLDLNKNKYSNSISIPDLDASRSDDISGFLGVNSAGNFFFLSHLSDNTFQIMVLNDTGSVITRKNLTMMDNEISYRDIYLDSSGLLVALLGKYDTVEIVWWRSDQLPGVQDEDSQP